MMFKDFLEVVLDVTFLATFGLVMAGFGPLAWSIWTTWVENGEKMDLQ